MSEDKRPATAAILTLGCKLNIADSEAMARRLPLRFSGAEQRVMLALLLSPESPDT
jgi:tRNA A37 methylthiotransferase MiaB